MLFKKKLFEGRNLAVKKLPKESNVISLQDKAQELLEVKREDDTATLPAFYYEVHNHHELFHLGKMYFEDMQAGVKCFAIGSLGYKTSQQRAILGLTSYFDLQKNLKVGIVSDNLYCGVFKSIISHCQLVPEFIPGSNLKIDIHQFADHFDFIDMNDILLLSDEEPKCFYSILDKFIATHDLVFFDVPDLGRIKRKFYHYRPLLSYFESLSIVVVKKMSDATYLNEIIDFYEGHGINLKGVVIDSKASAGNELHE